MSTVNQLITDSLRVLNVLAAGETAQAEDSADGLRALNILLDSLSNQGLMQSGYVERSKALTSGTISYSIGTGGDIAVTRPVRIANMFVRDSNGSDYEVVEINDEEYQAIMDKDLQGSYPNVYYYRNSYPLGYIYLYPAPGSGLTMYFQAWNQISQYTAVTDTLAVPPGYERYLKYQLAIDMAPEYGANVTQTVYDAANKALEYIKDVNNVNTPVMISEVALRVNNREYDNYYEL